MPKTVKKEVKKVVEKKVPKTEKKTSFYQAIGRRKESTARVKLHVPSGEELTIMGKSLKKGDMLINGKDISEYFKGEVYKKYYLEPFRTTNTLGRFITTVIVSGGGTTGQLGAVIHGIARALESVDKEKYRPILKKAGLMTRDPRAKERRKAGNAQKARAKKQSPKR